MVPIILLVMLTLFSCVTYFRNNIWGSALTLWEDTSRKSPNNIRPLFSLGSEYAKRGDYERAIELYQKAFRTPRRGYLDLQSDEYLKVYNELGLFYAQLGRYFEAIKIFGQILKINPDFVDAYNNIGAAYLNSGLYREAIEFLGRAAKRRPDLSDTHYNLAVAYQAVGDHDSAMKEYLILKQLSPALAAELHSQISGGR